MTLDELIDKAKELQAKGLGDQPVRLVEVSGAPIHALTNIGSTIVIDFDHGYDNKGYRRKG